ncbi:hypothetical protein BJ165DRAFT_1532210 [Panaeolus papilionaceus]|nr:hypothetical protein BJ165DRAFT_1532210 [Panaeolus papilionaceus]
MSSLSDAATPPTPTPIPPSVTVLHKRPVGNASQFGDDDSIVEVSHNHPTSSNSSPSQIIGKQPMKKRRKKRKEAIPLKTRRLDILPVTMQPITTLCYSSLPLALALNTREVFDVAKRQIRYLALTISLATQALIFARCKTKTFTTSDLASAAVRDEYVDKLVFEMNEWTNVPLFRDLLQYAIYAKHLFSPSTLPMLYDFLPTIETLYTFDPRSKLKHFKNNWGPEPLENVKQTVQAKVASWQNLLSHLPWYPPICHDHQHLVPTGAA